MKKEVPMDKAHRLINTGSVVLVSSASGSRRNIMSLAWQAPLSGKPRLVGIAVAAKHFTHQLITESREYVINIPGSELLEQVKYCGKISGRDADKFTGANLTSQPARQVGVPLIGECPGHLECRVVDQVKTGDHSLFVGEVVAASAEEKFFSDHWDIAVRLIHHLGGENYYFSSN